MENLPFRQLHKQFTEHKAVIERLTSSISADQQLLNLLEGLKKHAEKLDTPDAKFKEFEARINFTINHEELERSKFKTKMEEHDKAEEQRRYYDEDSPYSIWKNRSTR